MSSIPIASSPARRYLSLFFAATILGAVFNIGWTARLDESDRALRFRDSSDLSGLVVSERGSVRKYYGFTAALSDVLGGGALIVPDELGSAADAIGRRGVEIRGERYDSSGSERIKALADTHRSLSGSGYFLGWRDETEERKYTFVWSGERPISAARVFVIGRDVYIVDERLVPAGSS